MTATTTATPTFLVGYIDDEGRAAGKHLVAAPELLKTITDYLAVHGPGKVIVCDPNCTTDPFV